MNSSSSGLLELIGKLQCLESSFANILLEATLKLSILSEASVFILVETPEGRRFAGKDYLCDAFNRGTLRNSGVDQEMEVDAQISSLRPKVNGPRATRTVHHSPALGHSPIVRHSPTLGHSPTLPHSPSASSGCGTFNFTNRKRPSSTSCTTQRDDGDVPRQSNLSPSKQIKTEPLSSSTDDRDSQDLILIDDDDDDEDEVEKNLDILVDNYPDSLLEENCVKTERSSSSELPILDHPTSFSSCNDDVAMIMKPDHWLSQFMVENPKVHLIKSLDLSADLSKNSILRKIFDSVLYDLGRVAASSSPYQNDPLSQKSYLSQAFECWCRQLEHIDDLQNLQIEFGKNKLYKFKVYMRIKISYSFTQFMKRFRCGTGRV